MGEHIMKRNWAAMPFRYFYRAAVVIYGLKIFKPETSWLQSGPSCDVQLYRFPFIYDIPLR